MIVNQQEAFDKIIDRIEVSEQTILRLGNVSTELFKLIVEIKDDYDKRLKALEDADTSA